MSWRLPLTLTLTLTLPLPLTLTLPLPLTRYDNYVSELEKAYMAPDDDAPSADDPPAPDDSDEPPAPDDSWREVRDRRKP